MATETVRHLSITIAVPFDQAYAFAHQPANFARWAAGLARTLHLTERGWVADTPEGEALVLFSEPNPYGILDHRVRLAGRPEVYVPLRLIAHGDTTEVVLTLFRQPGMDDAMFERDAGLVSRDLASLKRVLESEPRPARP